MWVPCAPPPPALQTVVSRTLHIMLFIARSRKKEGRSFPIISLYYICLSLPSPRFDAHGTE